MTDIWKSSLRRSAMGLAVLALLAGCAAQRENSEGLELVQKGQAAQGLEKLKHAADLDPRNSRYQIDYIAQRDNAVQQLLDAADAQRAGEAWEAAASLYQQVLRLSVADDRARSGLKAVDAERRAAAQLQQGTVYLRDGKAEAALEIANAVLHELPRNVRGRQLQRDAEDRVNADRAAREEKLAARAALRRPVTMQFRDTPLKMAFEALSRVANVNVVIDRDVKTDLRTTIFVKDAALEDVIDVILLQNQLEKRILNASTIMIYPATAAKQKELAELKVRSFQLSNIDATLMSNILKTMLKTKDIVTDQKSNLLVMRDTPDAVALAERLIAANDIPDAEVMLEVNVLEVSSTHISDIGAKLPTSFTVTTPGGSSTSGTAGGGLTAYEMRYLTPANLLVNQLSASLNLSLTDSNTNLLASPRIRTRNKEKARILVGDKLPQITNLISPQQAGASTVVTGSIQYVDVGIKLDVEPEVYADGDVGIKLALEVSSVTDTIETQSGRAYQIGTRSASTSLRLHDGETQVMGGLINDQDRRSAQKLPGLGQVPMLGRLFSDHSDDARKSEIILTITPHVIRRRAEPDLRLTDAWSGSESTIRDRQLRLDPVGTMKAETPTGAAGAGAAVTRPPTGRGAALPPAATPNPPAPVQDPTPAPPDGGSDAAPAPTPPAQNSSGPASPIVPSAPMVSSPVSPGSPGMPSTTTPAPSNAPVPTAGSPAGVVRAVPRGALAPGAAASAPN